MQSVLGFGDVRLIQITEKSLSLGTAILITEFHEHAQKVGRCVNEVRVIENY